MSIISYSDIPSNISNLEIVNEYNVQDGNKNRIVVVVKGILSSPLQETDNCKKVEYHVWKKDPNSGKIFSLRDRLLQSDKNPIKNSPAKEICGPNTNILELPNEFYNAPQNLDRYV